jgi:hypothetical protein
VSSSIATRAVRPSRSRRGLYSTSSTAARPGLPPTSSSARELCAAHAARYRRADIGRFFRRHDIEVDAHAEAAGARGDDVERLVEHRVDATLADLVHEDHAHAEAPQALVLLGLVAAHADEAYMLRLQHAGSEPVERVVVLAEEPGERHAVEPPGVAGRGRVAVHVRVDPYKAEGAAAFFVDCARGAGPRAAGAAMVAAEHAGQAAVATRRGDRCGELAAELAHCKLPATLAGRRLEDRSIE